jgi:hypothetical protein
MASTDDNKLFQNIVASISKIDARLREIEAVTNPPLIIKKTTGDYSISQVMIGTIVLNTADSTVKMASTSTWITLG